MPVIVTGHPARVRLEPRFRALGAALSPLAVGVGSKVVTLTIRGELVSATGNLPA
ncbi:hypothetical protein ABT147_39025 [Streptomyces sp. NPDC001868]|uniref:hypothetical protein n=1 Tax=Streptomyces sp. NPDC001868 TaxID=3154401 RepID=UPI0033186C61